MKITNIFTLLLGFGLFLISCDNKKTSNDNPSIEKIENQKLVINKDLLIGSWKDQSAAALHFTLNENETAKSDNMTTLLYQNWFIKNNQINLVAKSIGNGTSSVDTLTYEIQKLDENEMILVNAGVISKFLRSNKSNDGQLDNRNETVLEQNTKVLSGELTFGHEANTFKPCGSDKVFWVSDKSGKAKKLYQELTEGRKPYTPIFAEIEIKDLGKAKEGFPADYESVYEVIKVIKTSKTISKDCQ